MNAVRNLLSGGHAGRLPTAPGAVANIHMAWVAVCVALYLTSFAVFYPGAITVSDEADYVQQAAVFAQGHVTVEHVNPLNGAADSRLPSRYAPGTSALMALPARVFGWRAVFIVPAIS